MGLTGDFDGLGRLAESLGRLARVPSQAAADASESLRDLVAEEFAQEADPNGDPWEAHADATVERWGEHKVLDLTGDMKSTVDVRPMSGAGIAITIEHPAEMHQGGTVNMPARPVLPEGDPLPPAWEDAISEACERAAERAMR